MDDDRCSSRELDRLKCTLDMIPDDTISGLEIGFHDFRMTHILREKLDIVSIDLPAPGNKFYVFFKDHIGNAWYEYVWKCPNCKNKIKNIQPNRIGYVMQRIIWRWEKSLNSKPAWILSLFKIKPR